MKLIFSIILFIALSLQINVFGQVVRYYEEGLEAKDNVVISGGKSVFVITISPFFGSNDFVTNREKKELEKNFRNLQSEVKVEYTNEIIFKNKNSRKFNFKESDKSPQRSRAPQT